MLPDVFPSDNVTDACVRRGYQFTEQLFYEAAKDAGFYGPALKDRAMSLHRLWAREGYQQLPGFCKDFILRINGGEHTSSSHTPNDEDRNLFDYPHE